MSRIVELSSGHVFDADSVRAMTDITTTLKPWPGCEGVYNGRGFDVIGVGYRVRVSVLPVYSTYTNGSKTESYVDDDATEKKAQELHREAVQKLLQPEQVRMMARDELSDMLYRTRGLRLAPDPSAPHDSKAWDLGSSRSDNTARGSTQCPHCHTTAVGWSESDLVAGYRWEGGTKVFHCREAAD